VYQLNEKDVRFPFLQRTAMLALQALY